MIKIDLTCPLGHTCEKVDKETGNINRCAWFTTLAGRNPQTGEQVDEKACAIAWLPVMQVEVAQSNRGTAEAVVSLREETIKRQDSLLDIALTNKPQLIYQDDGSRQQSKLIEVN